MYFSGVQVFHYYFSLPVIVNKFSHSNTFPKLRCAINYLYCFFCSLILLTHGDVETNPGPKKSHSYFSCCHLNVNSLIAHNELKVSLLEAYNIVHEYDFICISKTYFDSSVELDDDDLWINDYKLIRMDHTLNTKKGGACMYYKESSVVRMINISYLQECLLCEVMMVTLEDVLLLFINP